MSDPLEKQIVDILTNYAKSGADLNSGILKELDQATNLIMEIIYKELLQKPSKLRIGMLRQALNEDRITDPNKLVDNQYLEHWLGI